MPEQQFPTGRRIQLPGYFGQPVVLESIRPVRDGYECLVRFADGTTGTAIVPYDQAADILGMQPETSAKEARPHYHGHRARLRERFLKTGLAGFAEHEVVELVLTLAIPRKDVKQAAKALLARFGNLRGILDAPAEELRQVKEIGAVTAVALRIVREVANLYLQQKAEEQVSLASPDALYQFWRARLGGLRHEVFEVAYLDSAHRLMRDGIERMEEGTIDRASVYPRRVIEAALKRKAAAVVFAHNHPNGNVQPSEHDKVLTRALVMAATTVSIKVLDHLIVSPDEVFSFWKAGLL